MELEGCIDQEWCPTIVAVCKKQAVVPVNAADVDLVVAHRVTVECQPMELDPGVRLQGLDPNDRFVADV